MVLAFALVLLTFGGVTGYGAWTVQRLGGEVQRVVRDYLTVRLEMHDLQTRQFNLLQFLERLLGGGMEVLAEGFSSGVCGHGFSLRPRPSRRRRACPRPSPDSAVTAASA